MIEVNKIYNADCLELMNEIDDKSIDFICTDLPYGVTDNEEDKIIPFEDLWKHYKRIIKDNGCIALFAQGIFYVDLVNSNREMFKYDLVWDKILTSGFLNSNRMPLRVHEQIAIFYKELPTYNPQMTKGEKSHDKGTLYKMKEITNNNYGKYNVVESSDSTDKYPKSILTFQKPHPSKAKHRTEKSIKLLEYLIKTYTNKNELVLDSCCGSATTLIAAHNTYRNFIGIEKNENIFNEAKERLRVIRQRKRLF